MQAIVWLHVSICCRVLVLWHAVCPKLDSKKAKPQVLYLHDVKLYDNANSHSIVDLSYCSLLNLTK